MILENSSFENLTEGPFVVERKQEWIWVHFAVINIITFVSIAGNILVISVISNTRSLHTVTSVFIVTLSVCDLCTTLTVMLPSIVALVSTPHQSHQDQFCNFLGFCYIQFRIASIFALTSISIERCTAIQVPLKYATLVTKRRTTIIVALICAIPCLMALLPIFLNWNYSYVHTKGLCVPIYRDHTGYALVVLGGGVCVPLFITFAMYGCIAKVAVKQARKGVLVCDENHCQYVPSRKGEIKAVKTSCAITGVFFLCWLPYTITNLWSLSVSRTINVHWDTTCDMLTFLSAALNPCLYSLLNRTFRQALIKNYKKLSVNISECCLKQSDQTTNVSKLQSNAGKTLPHPNGNLSVSKVVDINTNAVL